MPSFIIDSIGSWGLKHSPFTNTRRTTPHPGDPILLPNDTIGRVVSTDHLGTGTIHICLEHGSAFLYQNGAVSISGGPFTNVMPDELHPTFESRIVGFWNWGNNFAGAHQGVDYRIIRPLFKLNERTQADKDRVNHAFQD